MLKTMKLLNKRPALYERSQSEFWNDSYISKNMLKAHLNPDINSASRTLDFINQSVNWISTTLPSNRFTRLLDLGCGPGIYSEKFYNKDYQVTGIDVSENSILYAKESAKMNNINILYLRENYMSYPFENSQYDVITMIYCDFGALTKKERQNILLKIYKSLPQGGYFLFDVFTPLKYSNQKEYKTWYFEEQGFWSPMPYLLLHNFYSYEKNQTFLNQYIVITDDSVTNYHLWDHTFTKDEIMADLHTIGFNEINFFSDVAGKPYSDTSTSLCVLAKK